jgi:hypothetical protein
MVSAFVAESGSTYNRLNIGGGTGLLNAITDLYFYTANGNKNVTGNSYGRLSTMGNWILGQH